MPPVMPGVRLTDSGRLARPHAHAEVGSLMHLRRVFKSLVRRAEPRGRRTGAGCRHGDGSRRWQAVHPNVSCQRFLYLYEAILTTPASKSAVGCMLKRL